MTEISVNIEIARFKAETSERVLISLLHACRRRQLSHHNYHSLLPKKIIGTVTAMSRPYSFIVTMEIKRVLKVIRTACEETTGVKYK
jgi:hypothetical protein